MKAWIGICVPCAKTCPQRSQYAHQSVALLAVKRPGNDFRFPTAVLLFNLTIVNHGLMRPNCSIGTKYAQTAWRLSRSLNFASRAQATDTLLKTSAELKVVATVTKTLGQRHALTSRSVVHGEHPALIVDATCFFTMPPDSRPGSSVHLEQRGYGTGRQAEAIELTCSHSSCCRIRTSCPLVCCRQIFFVLGRGFAQKLAVRVSWSFMRGVVNTDLIAVPRIDR